MCDQAQQKAAACKKHWDGVWEGDGVTAHRREAPSHVAQMLSPGEQRGGKRAARRVAVRNTAAPIDNRCNCAHTVAGVFGVWRAINSQQHTRPLQTTAREELEKQKKQRQHQMFSKGRGCARKALATRLRGHVSPFLALLFSLISTAPLRR
ncbi:hypothetical protein TRVL_05177 [Trypanosoma vivax]|nr:hypothetical protein TRVL_05177 [Trypanosoma vivax]